MFIALGTHSFDAFGSVPDWFPNSMVYTTPFSLWKVSGSQKTIRPKNFLKFNFAPILFLEPLRSEPVEGFDTCLVVDAELGVKHGLVSAYWNVSIDVSASVCGCCGCCLEGIAVRC